MALISLNSRITDSWEERCKHLKSPESLIYVKDRAQEDIVNPASMEIAVGDVYILPGDNKQYRIADEGLTIKPKKSVVIYSQQKIALPYNAFGIVTGKGNYIFQGCFISTGKIDPGFDGYLKIGFYNGGNKKVTLMRGKGFASVYFINTDFTMEHALEDYQTAPPANIKQIGRLRTFWTYVTEHWISFLAWGIVALPAAIYYVLQIISYFKPSA